MTLFNTAKHLCSNETASVMIVRQRHAARYKGMQLKIIFLIFSTKTYAVGTQKNRLNERFF